MHIKYIYNYFAFLLLNNKLANQFIYKCNLHTITVNVPSNNVKMDDYCDHFNQFAIYSINQIIN